MKKIYSYLLILVSSSECFGAQDYNGNRLSPSKIIFNNKTQNSYIQSAMQKTVNFDGLVDQTFGNLGSTYLDMIAPGSDFDECNSIAIQSDGKIVMGGYTKLNGTSYRFAAVRLTNDGSPDTSFGNNGLVYLNPIAPGSDSDGCNSIAIQPDGKIVMGGYTYLNGTDYRFAAVRLNADGSSDLNFGDNGSLYLNGIVSDSDYDVCSSIALQADGKIVMGGYTRFDGHNRFGAARLTTDGSPDTTFGDNGSIYFDPIGSGSDDDGCQSIALQADGKIVMVGYTSFNSIIRFAAARLNADGLPDTTFGDNGSMYLDVIAPESTNDVCNSIALQANGKIVMGGYTKLDNTDYRFAAARLNSDGSPDANFGDNGSIYLNQIITGGADDDECNSITLQSDGKIVMGGYTSLNDADYRFAAVRLTSNGSPDVTFGDGGLIYLNQIIAGGTDDECFSITLQPDGKIVMGGYTSLNDNFTDYRFAAVRLINPMTLQSYQTSYAVVGAGIYS